jgi:hypothetical protein
MLDDGETALGIPASLYHFYPTPRDRDIARRHGGFTEDDIIWLTLAAVQIISGTSVLPFI